MDVHEVRFSNTFISNAQNLNQEALKSLYDNFISVLKNGGKPENLKGKYKPSWEMPDMHTKMQAAFRHIAESKNLHHYHIGHRRYKPGRDPQYPGDVSEAIVHVQRHLSADGVHYHGVIKLDETHPSPFTVPCIFESIDYSRSA